MPRSPIRAPMLLTAFALPLLFGLSACGDRPAANTGSGDSAYSDRDKTGPGNTSSGAGTAGDGTAAAARTSRQ